MPQKEKRWHAKEAWPQKKKEKKGGNNVSKKERERDRDDSREKSRYLKE